MIRKILVYILLFICFIVIENMAAISQSAVITLSFPYGARGNAMGEVGTGLADDETMVFYNPAGLGAIDKENQYLGITSFYEPLLPIFELPELWHIAFSSCYKPKSLFKNSSRDIGAFGIMFNYLNFGENEQVDENGNKIRSFNSYEHVTGLSWGTRLTQHFYGGLSVKFVYSALAPGISDEGGGDGIGRTFAVDAGLLFISPIGIRCGLTFQNMGPNVSYIKEEEAYPIPFTITIAPAYKREFNIYGMRVLSLAGEFRLDKEIVNREEGKLPDPFWKALFTSEMKLSEIIQHFGGEVTVFNIGSLRYGLLYDKAGGTTESHKGFGVNLCNHFKFDYYIIDSKYESIVRHKQWGISFSWINLLEWKKNDLVWFLEDK